MSTQQTTSAAPEPAGVKERLRSLRLGLTVSVSGLDVTPLLAADDGARDYRMLHEAIADLAIEEVARGQVNRISAFNRGDRPVLILEGQTVTGAKQNRMVASTVLVAPQTMVELDVGCVEQGRWSPRYGAFEPGLMAGSPMMRAGTVREAKISGKVDQGRVWKTVAMIMSLHGEKSPSSDYVALLHKQHRVVDERARSLEPEPGQVGAIVLDRGRLVALELLGHDDAWRAMAQRLAGSYLLEAEMLESYRRQGHPGRERHAPAASAAHWLTSLAEARTTLHPAAGLGVRIALEGKGPRGEILHGAGLWYGDRPLHLAAFAAENEGGMRHDI